MLNWRMNRAQYLEPTNGPRPWVAIIFGGGVPTQACMQFLQRFQQFARDKGVNIEMPVQYDELTRYGLCPNGLP